MAGDELDELAAAEQALHAAKLAKEAASRATAAHQASLVAAEDAQREQIKIKQMAEQIADSEFPSVHDSARKVQEQKDLRDAKKAAAKLRKAQIVESQIVHNDAVGYASRPASEKQIPEWRRHATANQRAFGESVHMAQRADNAWKRGPLTGGTDCEELGLKSSDHGDRLAEPQAPPPSAQPKLLTRPAGTSPPLAKGKTPTHVKSLLGSSNVPVGAADHNGPAVSPPLSLKQKVQIFTRELSIDESLPMAAAVRAANLAIGLDTEGPLPSQVDKIISALRV